MQPVALASSIFLCYANCNVTTQQKLILCENPNPVRQIAE